MLYLSRRTAEPEIYWRWDIISFGRSSAAFISKSVIIYSCVCVYVCVHITATPTTATVLQLLMLQLFPVYGAIIIT